MEPEGFPDGARVMGRRGEKKGSAQARRSKPQTGVEESERVEVGLEYSEARGTGRSPAADDARRTREGVAEMLGRRFLGGRYRCCLG